MKLYTGLDIHKKSIYGTMMDEQGKIIDQRNFDNNLENLKQFLCCRPTKVVIEACGFWMDIYDKLVDEGYEVTLAHATRIKAIASAKLKSDKIDSKILADLLRCNLIPEAWAPPEEVRKHRDLVRFRCTLMQNRTRIKNKIKAILLKKGLRYGQEIWKGKRRNQLEGIGDSRINAYLRIMDSLNEEMKQVQKQIEEVNKDDHQAQLLKTIYGVSDYAARVILAEIGDISRFSSAKKLKSYAGMVPRMYQSGERCKMGSITKQGSAYLRWILVQCVHVALKNKGSRLAKFHYRLAQRKKKQVATIATACKLLEVIYSMLTNNKPYVS